MSGTIDADPYLVLGMQAAPVVVCRYQSQEYTPLPNVVCDQITYWEGAKPATAQFHYLLDVQAAAAGFPDQFEDLWPLDAAGQGVIETDDRLCVLSWTPRGDLRVLFDGHAQIPQADLSASSQRVSFTATHVSARCFDVPISGRRMRGSDKPEDPGYVEIDLPPRFNPMTSEGVSQPNMTKTPDHDENSDDPTKAYPVFLDESLKKKPDPRSAWTLGAAVRYLLSAYNDETYVDNPPLAYIDLFLQARQPTGTGPVDPSKPDSYKLEDIVVRDYDPSNQGWPTAVEHLVSYAGFGFRFKSRVKDNLPSHAVDIYRIDGAQGWSAKTLDLQESGSDIVRAPNTVTALRLARDMNSVVNRFTVETPPERVEIGVVLAPGFEPTAGDEVADNRKRFFSSELAKAGDDAAILDKYRLYIAAEDGASHFDIVARTMKTDTLDLSAIFADDDKGNETYVRRVRPGRSRLVTRDSKGERLRATLHLSRDYTGKAPAIWDGTGTWQQIAHGWVLLDDRLGIRVSIEDPEGWTIGQSTTEKQEPSKTIRGVTALSNPKPLAVPYGSEMPFSLRLTTVIESDRGLDATADMRASSPTSFKRSRRIEARDHFLKETVGVSSYLNPTNISLGADKAKAVVARDDTDKAKAHAQQLRTAHEMPPLAGSVTIPWLTDAYEVGDRVRLIRGRKVDLQTNVGAGQGEAPTYPRIISLTWNFAGDAQTTTLQLTDRRAEPAKA